MNINYFYSYNELIMHHLNLEQAKQLFSEICMTYVNIMCEIVLGTILSLYPVDIRRQDGGTTLNKFAQRIHFYS